MPEENKFIKLHAGDGGIVEKSAGVWLHRSTCSCWGKGDLVASFSVSNSALPTRNRPAWGMLDDYFYLCPEEAIHLMKMQNT